MTSHCRYNWVDLTLEEQRLGCREALVGSDVAAVGGSLMEELELVADSGKRLVVFERQIRKEKVATDGWAWVPKVVVGLHLVGMRQQTRMATMFRLGVVRGAGKAWVVRLRKTWSLGMPAVGESAAAKRVDGHAVRRRTVVLSSVNQRGGRRQCHGRMEPASLLGRPTSGV